MPASNFHAGRFRLLTIAGCLCLCWLAASAARRRASAQPSFTRAQRLREALERHPERQRTRGDYERVMDTYRLIYHSNPASPQAAAASSAVADLLAEEGRIFRDPKTLHDAVGQYEFLRSNYPRSRYRESALLAEGEIYLRDLNDAANARAIFQQFVNLYPQSQLAAEARIELRDLRQNRRVESARIETPAPIPPTPIPSPHRPRRRNVFGAADQPNPRPSVPASPHKQPTYTTESNAAPSREPVQTPSLSNARLSTSPASTRNALPLVTGIRFWSTPVYTRVAIDLQDEVRYEAVRVPDPDRIFFDLYGTRLSPQLIGKSDQVIDGGFLQRIRTAQLSSNMTRIVLNVSHISEYYAFFLPNPPRLIIDVRGTRSRAEPVYTAAAPKSKPAPEPMAGPKPRRTLRPGASAAVRSIGLDPNTVAANELGEPLPPATDVDSLSSQPNRVRATRRPTMAPVAQSVAPQQPDELAMATPPKPRATPRRAPEQEEVHAATPSPQLSMVRTLGLKINRIVIDAGHGGHDSGTLGPDGVEEKNVVLDVALRLGALLKQRLGADVIYTRDNDTFIPLETRTAIANKDQADLFISIHANSSPDPSVRGVETYYLNFTSSADALEVAARENAVSDRSIHQLSDLVKKIALQDKIEESREFASDVEQSLYQGLESGNPGLKDRGVKKAPFVVLIGANMPSILTEISFLTNSEAATELRQPQYRERIAEALYRGVARYVDSLNGVRLADAAPSAAP